MKPEAELLLACVRMDANGIRRALRNPIHWESLIELADAHAVTALVYSALQDAASVPAFAMSELSGQFFITAARCLLLTSELHGLMRLFESAGIRAVPFKGPVLSSMIYGNPAMRAFDDLDILVRRQDVSCARELLRSQGYGLRSDGGDHQERTRFHWNSQMTFVRADGLVELDVHWDILPRHFPFTPPTDELMRNLQPARIGGEQFMTLVAEDLLLYLCAHGAKHVWQRLAWICDLAGLIRTHSGLDWAAIVARSAGSERMLRVALILAIDVAGAKLPTDVHRWIERDAVARAIASEVQQRLIGSLEPLGTRRVLSFNIRLTRFPWRKVRYRLGLAMLPSESDWSAIRLPSALALLYYPLRIVRLAAKYTLRRCTGPRAAPDMS